MIYDAPEEDPDYAKMSPLATSETSLPKVATRSDGISQVDTVGFHEKRDHLGIFSLNYTHQQMLKIAQNALFQIVFGREFLESPEAILETVLSFITLFSYETLSPEMKEDLLNSVALVITKTSKADENEGLYLLQLEGLCEEWADPAYRKDKKELCIEILLSLLKRRMIGYFSRASKDSEAPRSTLVDEFSQKGWKPFDLAAAREKCPALVSNNFPRDFKQMLPEDQNKYQSALQRLIDTFTDGAKVFSDLIEICLHSFTMRKADFSRMFERMREVIQVYDEYAETEKELSFRLEETGISLEDLPSGESPEEMSCSRKNTTTVQRMNELLSLFESGHQYNFLIENHDTSPDDKYKLLSSTTKNCLFQMKEICCFTREEGKMFVDFSYILLQGIEALHQIEIMDPDNAAGSNYKIEAAFGAVFDKSISDLRSQMITQVFELSRNEKEENVFPTPAESLEFIELAENYVSDAQGNDPANYPTLLVSLVRERIQYQERITSFGKSDQVIRMALKTDCQLRTAKREFKAMDSALEEENSAEIETISNSYLQNFKILGGSLMYNGKYDFSIEILKEIGDSSSVQEAYRAKLESKGRGVEKEEVFIAYAEYCASHGNIPKALEILQSAKSEVDNYKTDNKFNEKIAGIIRGQQGLMEEYLREVESFEPFFKQEKEEPAVLNQISDEYPDIEEAFTEPDAEQGSKELEA